MIWPQEIIKQLGREPRVGDWYAECCILDLFRVETEEQLASILDLQDDFFTGGQFWPDEETALKHVAIDRPEDLEWYRKNRSAQSGEVSGP